MKFTAPEEYGLRCILQMARHEQGTSFTINDLAELEALTPAYVAKIMRILRQAGLVESTRGQKGGYILAKLPSEMSVADVVGALGGKLHSDEYCKRYSGNARNCVHTGSCHVKTLWQGVDWIVESILSKCMLSDLIMDKAHIDSWVRENIGKHTKLMSAVLPENLSEQISA